MLENGIAWYLEALYLVFEEFSYFLIESYLSI